MSLFLGKKFNSLNEVEESRESSEVKYINDFQFISDQRKISFINNQNTDTNNNRNNINLNINDNQNFRWF